MHGAALEHLPLTLNCAMRKHLQSSVRIAHDVGLASAAAAADDDDEFAGSRISGRFARLWSKAGEGRRKEQQQQQQQQHHQGQVSKHALNRKHAGRASHVHNCSAAPESSCRHPNCEENAGSNKWRVSMPLT